MEKATINIEVIDNGETVCIDARLKGTAILLMEGLVYAIHRIEDTVPEGHVSNFRAQILEMLNDRD